MKKGLCVAVLKKLYSLLSAFRADGVGSEPDIRYSDPTHDPRHLTKSRSSSVGIKVDRSLVANSQPNRLNRNELDALFSNEQRLYDLTLGYIARAGLAGVSRYDINNYIVSLLISDSVLAEKYKSKKWVRAKLADCRKSLKHAGKIFYDDKLELWALAKTFDDNDRHSNGNSNKYGLGSGWVKINDPLDVVYWMHKNYRPDDYENFAVRVLSDHCGVPVSLTEKRRYSGADGGFDAVGVYNINGIPKNIAVQVKLYSPERQVGEDQCDRFAGALIKRDWQYGILITTGKFSKRCQESVAAFKLKNYWIELIDQDRLVQIMLSKSSNSQGFGLCKFPSGEVFMNELQLRQIAKNSQTDNNEF